jgi:SAM-dependent methyltransferase
MNNKNIEKEKKYWENFYSVANIKIPSQFCILFANEISKEIPVIEFGCGNGRDSIFLAQNGYNVYAVDASNVAIDKCKDETKLMKNIIFLQGNVSNESVVKKVFNTAREENTGKPVTVYSRFFIHSINEEEEDLFLRSLSEVLISGENIYFEFREKQDEMLNKIYKDHYRRYIDEETFINNLVNKYGFNVVYKITGKGMAKYFDEDPIVCRIIAKKI